MDPTRPEQPLVPAVRLASGPFLGTGSPVLGPSIFDATPADFAAHVYAPRDLLVLVAFWSPGCPNCEAFEKDTPALLAALEGESIALVRVNAVEHFSLAHRFGLVGTPTFVLLRDGRLLGKLSRYAGWEYLLAVVREHLPARAG